MYRQGTCARRWMQPARAGRALQAELESRRYPVAAITASPHCPRRESTSRVRRRGKWRSKEVGFVRGDSITIHRRLECYGARKAGKREALLILMHET